MSDEQPAKRVVHSDATVANITNYQIELANVVVLSYPQLDVGCLGDFDWKPVEYVAS